MFPIINNARSTIKKELFCCIEDPPRNIWYYIFILYEYVLFYYLPLMSRWPGHLFPYPSGIRYSSQMCILFIPIDIWIYSNFSENGCTWLHGFSSRLLVIIGYLNIWIYPKVSTCINLRPDAINTIYLIFSKSFSSVFYCTLILDVGFIPLSFSIFFVVDISYLYLT